MMLAISSKTVNTTISSNLGARLLVVLFILAVTSVL